jgi:hypothetical protein
MESEEWKWKVESESDKLGENVIECDTYIHTTWPPVEQKQQFVCCDDDKNFHLVLWLATSSNKHH